MSELSNDITVMKVSELRESYDRDEVTIERVETPRARKHIFSPTTKTQEREARKAGKSHIAPVDLEEIVWDVDLDERTNWLVSGNGEANLLVKNVLCHVRTNADEEGN